MSELLLLAAKNVANIDWNQYYIHRLMKIILTLIITAFFHLVFAQSVLNVTNLADNGAGSLRTQILNSFPGDTVRIIVTGTITLTTGELNFNKDLIIEGPGMDDLIITPASPDYLMIMSGDVRLSGMTFLNGYSTTSSAAGGVTYTGGTLNMNDVKFEGCQIVSPSNLYGGAFMADCDSIFINECDFVSNNASSNYKTTRGGALYVSATKQVITNCTFELNQTSAGALTSSGVYSAYSYGGAAYLDAKAYCDILVDSCSFADNTCSATCLYSAGGTQGKGYAHGGGLYIDGSPNQTSIVVRNSYFIDNEANGSGYGTTYDYSYGGAIAIESNDSPTPVQMKNLILDGNETVGQSSYSEGGAIHADDCSVKMTNLQVTNTIAKNGAIGIVSSDYAEVTWSEFSDNLCMGLRLQSVDDSYVSNCLFNNNSNHALNLRYLTGPNRTVNCTFTKNSSVEGSSMNIRGCTSGNIDILNCTMMDDTVLTSGNAISMYIYSSPNVFMKNNIVSTPTFTADPLVEIVSGSFVTSGGGNIIRDASASTYLTQPSDMNSANPMLGVFTNHGGPHETYDLLVGSPAIDLGGTDTLTIDHRGFTRDALIDAGSYEFGASSPNMPNVVALGSDETICANDTVDIWVTSNSVPADPVQFQWMLNGSIISGANNNNLEVTTTVAGTYYYTCELSNSSGALVSDTITVTVNALPNIVASGTATICEGLSSIISASGASSYLWDNGVGSGSPVSVSPAMTTTYTVTGTDGNGCENTDQVTINVNALPTVTASGVSSICIGNSTTLNATGASTYLWDNGAGSGASVSVSPSMVTTYTVVGTDGNGCENTDQITVTVNSLPTVTAFGAATICDGASTTLTASGALTYLWDNGAGSGATVSVSPSATTTYTVTGTDANGCTNMDQTSITVNSLPTVTASGAATICEGLSSIISASGASSYLWDNGVGSGSPVSVSPAMTTTYTVTGTDGNGCENTDQVTINVNALPTVTASGVSSICIGNSTTLNATGASTYLWDNGAGSGASVSVSPSMVTTYTVVGTDGNGCENTDQITVAVNSLPTVTASGAATICEGASTTLTASGALTYLWDNGAGSGATVSVSPSVTTIYTVTGTDANGCTNMDQTSVTVNPLPTVTASGAATICEGESTLISASGASTYLWDNGAGSGGIVSVSPVTTTVYTVTGTDGNGCENIAQVPVTVNVAPDVSASSDVSICEGESTSLTASGALTYSWDNGVGAGASVSVSPITTTTYEVTGTDGNGCEGTDLVIVTVNTLPTVTMASLGTTCTYYTPITLSGESPSGGTFSGTGVTGALFDPGVGLGTYTITYTYTDGNGCTNTATSDIIVDDCASIDEQEEPGISIYPNPNRGLFTIEVSSEGDYSKIEITDASGRVVYNPNEMSVINPIDIREVPSGVYFLNLSGEKKVITHKIIIE